MSLNFAIRNIPLSLRHVLKLSCSSTARLTTSSEISSRSMWSLSCTRPSPVTTSRSPWMLTSAFQLHTSGDKELVTFLKDEIKVEKKNEKPGGKLPNIKGFEVTSTEGPNVVLTKKSGNETITIRFNVNNSVDDTQGDVEHEPQEEKESQMVSRPPFLVEICKGGNKTLALQCVFPHPDEMPAPTEHAQEENYEDVIEIQDVALLDKSQEWTDDVYSLAGGVMDGNLYDMLLKMLEERGIDGEFIDHIIEFSTAYEHKKYIGLLEQLKEFVDTK